LNTFVFVFIFLFSSIVSAGENDVKSSFCGTIVSVTTGNHVTLEDANRIQSVVRLAWIFAPEQPQTNYLAAKMRLDKLSFNRAACVDVLKSYGKKNNVGPFRYYGVVTIKDLGDLGLEMLNQGMAWHYTPYASKGQKAADYAKYAVAEREARANSYGIWADKSSISPWVFQGKTLDSFK
jgi:endonuclease YncB( thermonuclease family)